MLEQNPEPISKEAETTNSLWDALDLDRNGSLSKSELISSQDNLSKIEHKESAMYLYENFDDLANLEGGWFDSDNELELADIELLDSLTTETLLDAKHFDKAKNFLSQNSSALDTDENGLLSAEEIDAYKSNHEVSPENRSALEYLKSRINGEYSNEIMVSQNEIVKRLAPNSSYFGGEIDIKQFDSISLEDRISQTQKDIVSKSFMAEWEENTQNAGEMAGIAISTVIGPASGPGGMGAPAAGYLVGGLFGAALGREIGRHRGQNYYENTQRARINRLLN